MLDCLGQYVAGVPDDPGQKELHELREYIAKRIPLTDYPSFLKLGYDIGSGPTESFCGCLTKRLKGAGMRWDKDNAEAVMALANVASSGYLIYDVLSGIKGSLTVPLSLVSLNWTSSEFWKISGTYRENAKTEIHRRSDRYFRDGGPALSYNRGWGGGKPGADDRTNTGAAREVSQGPTSTALPFCQP
jgi:hypothetical protein